MKESQNDNEDRDADGRLEICVSRLKQLIVEFQKEEALTSIARLRR